MRLFGFSTDFLSTLIRICNDNFRNMLTDCINPFWACCNLVILLKMFGKLVLGAELNVTRLTLEMCNGVYFYTSYAHHMANKFYLRLNKFHLSARFINGTSYGLQLSFEDTARIWTLQRHMKLVHKKLKNYFTTVVNIWQHLERFNTIYILGESRNSFINSCLIYTSYFLT